MSWTRLVGRRGLVLEWCGKRGRMASVNVGEGVRARWTAENLCPNLLAPSPPPPPPLSRAAGARAEEGPRPRCAGEGRRGPSPPLRGRGEKRALAPAAGEREEFGSGLLTAELCKEARP